MYPVLLNIGNFQISSFGFFLTIGMILGSFAVWRIARGYELDSEKTLDFIFLTIGAGVIASRLFYVLTNLSIFDTPSKVIFLNRYPGLSFWGGLAGALLVLIWLTKKNKISLLQAGDFALVGFMLAAFFAHIGCLLGGCGLGIESGLFFAVPQVGVIGNRIPVQFFEALIFLMGFLVFWKSALKFHVQGSIFAKGLILIGIIKFIALNIKAQPQMLKVSDFNLNLDLVGSVVVAAVGMKLYYQIYKKTPLNDLNKLWRFLTDRKTQSLVLANISKGWYNHWVNLQVMFGRGRKRIFKFLHIKPNPDNF